MEATISALLNNINNGLNRPYLFSPEFWTLTISSLIALISSLVALFIAGGIGSYIKPRIGIKPELELLVLNRYIQASHYWRLSIRNKGRETAKSVQIDVTKIIDEGKKRKNFIPVPLRWTHYNCESRDILPKQTVNIDVLEHISKIGNEKVKLITNHGGGVDDFEVIKNGYSKITITVYLENGTSFTKMIEVSWHGGAFLDTRLEGEKWHLTKNGRFI